MKQGKNKENVLEQAMNGQQEEFEAALRKLRGKDDISYERSTIQVCL